MIFFICDIYSGSELSGDCFNLFMQLANNYPTWANIIINNNISRYEYLLNNLEQDMEINLLSFPVARYSENKIDSGNWVLTNQTKILPKATYFVLFEKLNTQAAINSRKIYQQLITQIPAKYFY